MAKKKKEEEPNPDQSLEMLMDLGETFGPMLLKNKELDVPIIKRQQYMNFSIMLIICLGVIFLTYFKVIDGSAATGLLGAVIGYVFGHIYSRGDKR